MACRYLFPLFAGVMWASGPQPELTKLVDEVRQLQAEVREMKSAIAQLQLERQRAIVAQIQSELELVSDELARLEVEDTERQEQLRETETHLNSPDLSDEQRAEAQTIQVELAVTRSGEIAKRRQGLLERETQLRRRLAEERIRLESRLPARR
jgi:hypothetical protein